MNTTIIIIIIISLYFVFFNNNITNITSGEQLDTILQSSNIPVILFISMTSGCKSCNDINPFFTEYSNKYKNKIKFLKVKVNDQFEFETKINRSLSTLLDGFPTFITFKNKKKFDNKSDSNKDNLEKLLTNLLY